MVAKTRNIAVLIALAMISKLVHSSTIPDLHQTVEIKHSAEYNQLSSAFRKCDTKTLLKTVQIKNLTQSDSNKALKKIEKLQSLHSKLTDIIYWQTTPQALCTPKDLEKIKNDAQFYDEKDLAAIRILRKNAKKILNNSHVQAFLEANGATPKKSIQPASPSTIETTGLAASIKHSVNKIDPLDDYTLECFHTVIPFIMKHYKTRDQEDNDLVMLTRLNIRLQNELAQRNKTNDFLSKNNKLDDNTTSSIPDDRASVHFNDYDSSDEETEKQYKSISDNTSHKKLRQTYAALGYQQLVDKELKKKGAEQEEVILFGSSSPQRTGTPLIDNYDPSDPNSHIFTESGFEFNRTSGTSGTDEEEPTSNTQGQGFELTTFNQTAELEDSMEVLSSDAGSEGNNNQPQDLAASAPLPETDSTPVVPAKRGSSVPDNLAPATQAPATTEPTVSRWSSFFSFRNGKLGT